MAQRIRILTPEQAEAQYATKTENAYKLDQDAVDARVRAVGDATYAPVYGITMAELDAAASPSDVINARIAQASAAGGGIVLLPAGTITLDKKALDANQRGNSITLASNVTLRGQGIGVTTLELDPAGTPIASGDRYWVVRIGTETVPANNVTIEHLTIDGSQVALLNGQTYSIGSIFGIGARHDLAGIAEHSDNVTVQDVRIYDTMIAIGCTKEGNATNAQGATRLGQQFRNWKVLRAQVELTANKAIELAECNGGVVADCVCEQVEDGIQAIFSSRGISIERNRVRFLASGINITQGASDVRVIGNIVEAHPNAPTAVNRGALSFRAEPQTLTSTISNIVVAGNTFRDTVKNEARVLAFQSRAETTAVTYEHLVFEDNFFGGNINMHDVLTPAPGTAKTTLRNLRWGRNTVTGSILTNPAVTIYDKVGPVDFVLPTLLSITAVQTAWPAATQARFFRFDLAEFATIRKILLEVGLQSGNIQAGIVKMGEGLAYTRVADTGVIACPAAGNHELDLGANIALPPGKYAFFLWADNATVQLPLGTASPAQAMQKWGVHSSLASGVQTSGTMNAWSNRTAIISATA